MFTHLPPQTSHLHAMQCVDLILCQLHLFT